MSAMTEGAYLGPDPDATPTSTTSTPILDFLSGSRVFITGGTGFLGRVLLEKLLRVAPDLEEVYLLVRPKKGKEISARLDDIFDDPLYSRLVKESPKARLKVRAVPGDCSLPGLGMSQEDRQVLIDNVDIVFHAAATIRFDEKLRTAVAINVVATRDILALCKLMPRLKAAVHVSTAYCNCHLKEIEERFYDPPMDYLKLIPMVEACDEHLLDVVTPVVLDRWPNSYAMTKAVAEDVVRREKGDLPVVVFRPAIVVASRSEPVPGWIDNLYGPTGVVVGAATGLLKSLHCDPDAIAEIVPVDMVVNAMIASAWDVNRERLEKAKQEEEEEKKKKEVEFLKEEDPPVYNYVSSCETPLNWREFCRLNEHHGLDVPALVSIWYYSLTLNKHYYVHRIYSLFLHLLPGILVDGALRVMGKEPRLMKVYKKIDKFSSVISYFCTQTWKFDNRATRSLWSRVAPGDRQIFPFSMADVSWDDFFYTYIRGCRQFIAKEDLSTLPRARAQWRRFFWMHQTIKVVFTLACLRLAWALISVVYSAVATT